MGHQPTNAARDWSPLKGAVLGLLLVGPSYGYDLANRLQRQLGPAWKIHRKTIYTILEQLEAQGLVHPEPTASTEGRAVHNIVYHATPLAEPAFERWLEGAPPLQNARVQLHAKMVAARMKDLPRLLVALDHYERALFAREAEIEAGLPPRQSLCAAMMYMVRDSSIKQIRSELLWAGDARQMILDLLAS